MTVIACKDGIMAADSGVWCDAMLVGHTQKISRLPDGSLFAAGGSSPVIQLAKDWLLGGGPKPDRVLMEDELDGLLLRPDGIWRLSSQWDLYLSPSLFETAGSHHEFMFGAMHAGASAEKAVALAIQHGAYGRGAIQVEYLIQRSPAAFERRVIKL